MSRTEDLKAKAMKIPTMAWFRAIGPKIFPPMHRTMAKLSGGRWHPGAAIILTTTGAKSGQERKSPLEMIPRDDGSFLVVGSNFAGETHPAWTWNLLAHPDATVLYEGRERAVKAELLEGGARDEAWQRALEHWPAWQEYTEITERQFRIFHLVPAA